MADWKLFAKGLAAFRSGEDEDARAKLGPARSRSARLEDRAEPGRCNRLRAARRIGQPQAGRARTLVLGEPILGPLRDLASTVSQGYWPEAIRKLGPIRLALRRVDPSLAVRLTKALYSPLLREATDLSFREGTNLIRSFTKSAEPLPIDPRWNRLWAQVWEGPQGHPDEAEPFWRKYVDDLGSSTVIRPEDRSKAKALVLTHMGRQWTELASEFDPEEGPLAFAAKDPSRSGKPGLPARLSEEASAARRKALAVLEEESRSPPLAPSNPPGIARSLQGRGSAQKAAEAARRMLESLPDDLEILKYLGLYHLGREEPEKALQFVLRARASRSIPNCSTSSGDAASAPPANSPGKADGTRLGPSCSTAERLSPESSRTMNFAASKASLELKAGQPEAAETIIQESLEPLDEPTPFWLAMAIEARRYQLPPDVVRPLRVAPEHRDVQESPGDDGRRHGGTARFIPERRDRLSRQRRTRPDGGGLPRPDDSDQVCPRGSRPRVRLPRPCRRSGRVDQEAGEPGREALPGRDRVPSVARHDRDEERTVGGQSEGGSQEL